MSTTGHGAACGLSPKQSQALASDRDVSIRAGAGSGKTRTITEKIFDIIRRAYDPADPDSGLETLGRILCISFTNKAAAELAERVALRLASESEANHDPGLRAYFGAAAERIDSLAIMTLDSFFTSVLRRFAFRLGISPSFTPAAGGRSDILFRDAVLGVLDSMASDRDREAGRGGISVFDDFYSFYRKKDAIHSLFARILSKSVYISDPLFIFRTREEFEGHIKERIASINRTLDDFEFSELLRSDEFASAMEHLGVIAPGLGKASSEKARGLFEAYGRFASGKAAAREFFEFLASGFKGARLPAEGSDARTDALRRMLGLAKRVAERRSGSAAPERETRLSEMEFDFFSGLCAIFDKCRVEYRRIKEARNLLDFIDIESLALKAARDGVIRDFVAGEYSHILIDEFQDTNDHQSDIIKLIRGGAKLTIVGDGMQSIYRFRNANCDLFARLEKEITDSGGLTVNLNDNYRSSGGVLNFINGFFSTLDTRSAHPFSDFKYSPLESLASGARELDAAVEVGLFASVTGRSRPNSNPGAAPEDPVRREDASGENDAAGDSRERDSSAGSADGSDDEFDAGQFDFIARRAVELHRAAGYKYSEMMILLSRMSHVDRLASALAAAGAPFVITGSRRFFGRPEILDMLNLVKSLVDPRDDLALTGLLRSPVFAVPDCVIFALVQSFRETSPGPPSVYRALEKLASGELEFDRVLSPSAFPPAAYEIEKTRLIKVFEAVNRYSEMGRHKSAFEVLSTAAAELGFERRYDYEGDFGPVYGNIGKLFAHILENDYLPDGPLQVFVENFRAVVDIEFAEEESQSASPSSDAIRIMTVHQAKGLEEKVVFIPELEADFFRASDTGVIVSRDDIAFQPAAFVRLNPDSLLKDYHEAVKNFERAQELFEKKRLLYVAMTRAKELLVLSGTFRLGINSAGRVRASKLEKMPFVLANCQLTWVANYLGLDAGFFLSGDSVRELNGPYGRVRVYLKPPAGPVRQAQQDRVFHDGAEREASPVRRVIIPPGAPKFNDIAAINDNYAAAALPPALSWSEFKKLSSAGGPPGVSTAASPQPFDLKRFLGDKLVTVEGPPAGENEIGAAFHLAVSIAAASRLSPRELAAGVSSFSSAACGRTAFPGAAARASASSRVEKMLSSLLANAARCGLDAVFAGASSRAGVRVYSELAVSCVIEGMVLEGVCDLLTVGPSGAAVIYDFKTVRKASALPRERIEDYERQLAFYQLCAASGLAGISSFGSPVVVIVESSPPFGVSAIKLSPGSVSRNQDEIIKKCGGLFK